jgi:hypothetical protein
MALWNLPPDIDGGHFCRTFQFPNLLKLAVTCPNFRKIFGSFAPQATKNFYIGHMTAK